MKNVFDQNDVREILQRIEKLSPGSQPLWGKMNVGQMLAHCNVTYELAYDSKHPRPNPIARFLLKLVVKPIVVSEKPYGHKNRTAPVFLVTPERDFAVEKRRLTDYLTKTLNLGAAAFDGKESHSFGACSSNTSTTTFANSAGRGHRPDRRA